MEREKTLTILYSVSKIVLQTRVMQSMNKMLNNDFFGFFHFRKMLGPGSRIQTHENESWNRIHKKMTWILNPAENCLLQNRF